MKTAALLWLIALLLPAGAGRAQNYQVQSNGGTATSSGGSFNVTGSFGQPDALVLRGGGYSLTGGFQHLGVAVQQLDAPVLSLAHVGGNVVLSWPATATEFLVEVAASLAAPVAWRDAGATPVLADGRYSVTLPAAVGVHFYRLRLP